VEWLQALDSRWLSEADPAALNTTGQYATNLGCPPRRVIIALETRATAPSLQPLECEGKQDIERLLYDAFVEDAYDGELFVLSCRDADTRRLAGVIFWRTMTTDEIVARRAQALVKAYPDAEQLEYDHAAFVEESKPLAAQKRWVKIELLATDRTLPRHDVGKTMLGAAMQFAKLRAGMSSVALRRLEEDREDSVAAHLALRFGFKEELSAKSSDVLSVVWDIENRLRGLLCPRNEAHLRAPLQGRLASDAERCGHRIGIMSPGFGQMKPYNAGCSPATAKHGDPQHPHPRSQLPDTTHSISAGRILWPKSSASNFHFANTQYWHAEYNRAE